MEPDPEEESAAVKRSLLVLEEVYDPGACERHFAYERQIFAVPVLAEPTKHQVANVVKVHEGEAREGNSVETRKRQTNSRGGEKQLWLNLTKN